MALKSPVKTPSEPSSSIHKTPLKPPLDTSPIPATPAVIPKTPATTHDGAASAVSSRQPEPPSSDADIVKIPSYSRWFSWNDVHECEVRFLPEFFNLETASKNCSVYLYLRNSIINKFRENPTRKLTFTETRKGLIGDVGSVRRVFDFLEAWGLINYAGTVMKHPSKWEDKDNNSNKSFQSSGTADLGTGNSVTDPSFPARRWCSGCKTLCSIACFASDKFDLTLCARCYVCNNYQEGVISSDFRRVEINEETRSEWTEKEILQLLEAVLHYGDDWKRIAEHVGAKSEKECVTRFVKLPFGEEFLKHPESGEIDNKFYHMKERVNAEFVHESTDFSSPSKKARLTPLADASNPIMAQAAFLSALVGVEVAEAAAQAAVTALSDINYSTIGKSFSSLANDSRHQECDVESNADTAVSQLQEAYVEAELQLQKEAMDAEIAISGITDQMNEIQEKIIQFEEFDLQMEKERERLQQVKNTIFTDQLSLLFHKTDEVKDNIN